MTISTALNMRSPDFPGVVTCTSTDSLASLLSLIKTRRVHRLVVLEGDVSRLVACLHWSLIGYFASTKSEREERKDVY
jgi:5'-AMP-activated protein kinase regulatory gamma subunit